MGIPVAPSFTLGQKATAQEQQDQSDVITWLEYLAYGTYSQVTSAQAIADSTDTAIAWNSNIRQNKITHSTSSSNTRITPNEPGLYLCMATAALASATGIELWFRQNGSGTEGSAPSGGAVTGLLYFNGVSDYVEVMMRQQSGGSLNMSFGRFNPRFSLMWQSGLV